MNLFARGVGGVVSDALHESMGMRGRLIVQTILLLFEGAAVLIFSTTDTLGGAILALVFFSLFVQAAEGASYGIVPYVNPRYMGSVSGIVGAGGNVGAVLFGLGFREFDYRTAFVLMGGSVLLSAFLSVFINIKGYSRLFGGKDLVVDKETGEIVESENGNSRRNRNSNKTGDEETQHLSSEDTSGTGNNLGYTKMSIFDTS